MSARTILIVDDEPASRYALRRALEHAYRIAEAESAPAAREALVRERPDLVLLDIVMNDEDGLVISSMDARSGAWTARDRCFRAGYGPHCIGRVEARGDRLFGERI